MSKKGHGETGVETFSQEVLSVLKNNSCCSSSEKGKSKEILYRRYDEGKGNL